MGGRWNIEPRERSMGECLEYSSRYCQELTGSTVLTASGGMLLAALESVLLTSVACAADNRGDATG